MYLVVICNSSKLCSFPPLFVGLNCWYVCCISQLLLKLHISLSYIRICLCVRFSWHNLPSFHENILALSLEPTSYASSDIQLVLSSFGSSVMTDKMAHYSLNINSNYDTWNCKIWISLNLSWLILKSSSKRLLVVGKIVNDFSVDRNAFNFRVKQFKKGPRNSQEDLNLLISDLFMIWCPSVGEGLRFAGWCLSLVMF